MIPSRNKSSVYSIWNYLTCKIVEMVWKLYVTEPRGCCPVLSSAGKQQRENTFFWHCDSDSKEHKSGTIIQTKSLHCKPFPTAMQASPRGIPGLRRGGDTPSLVILHTAQHRVAELAAFQRGQKWLQKLSSISRACYFRDKCFVFARNCKFANLTQYNYNMQCVPCNTALLAQETLFLSR